MQRFVYVFLDGVGLGTGDAVNPFTPYELPHTSNLVQPAPGLFRLLGGPLLAGLNISQPHLLLRPLDATLGVLGRPQSATGQAALYTGRNAPAFLGRHLTGFANGSLRILVEESGIFKQILAAGGTVTLANFYPPGYFEAIAQRRIRYAVGTLLALTAEVPFRGLDELERGAAVNWDIDNRYLGLRGIAAPRIAPAVAGERLANISRDFTLTLFECFLPDYAGHDQNLEQAREVIGVVDAFLTSLFGSVEPETTVIVSSDHGNIENLSQRVHTLNPVPLLVKGPAAPSFAHLENIMQITPTIVSLV